MNLHRFERVRVERILCSPLMLSVLAMLASVLGCPTPRGGWDVEALIADEPGLAALGAHQLGEMVPYPVPDSSGIDLVSCRWPSESPIRVRLNLSGDRLDWASRAIESLSRGMPSLDLEVEGRNLEKDFEGLPSRRIEIFERDVSGGDGPMGVGDTLLICDVSMRTNASFGTPIRAEIQMRSSVMNQIDERVVVSAEDWTGALMHELGHALGFQGHLRSGRSVLVRDQSHLRRIGRQVLAGEPWFDETLEALYRLEPGQLLGRRKLSSESLRWLNRIEQYRSHSAKASDAGSGPRASVGDRHGRLEWMLEGGVRLRLHFPFWSRQLQSRAPVVAFPGTDTRDALAPKRARTSSPR